MPAAWEKSPRTERLVMAASFQIWRAKAGACEWKLTQIMLGLVSAVTPSDP